MQRVNIKTKNIILFAKTIFRREVKLLAVANHSSTRNLEIYLIIHQLDTYRSQADSLIKTTMHRISNN